MIELTTDYVSKLAPVRSDEGNKGTFGKVLIIAGSKFMTGAQTLATLSALNSGVGLVQVFAPEDSLMPTQINCPCAILSAYGDTPTATIKKAAEILANRVKAVVIGPGLDTSDSRNAPLLEYVIEHAPRLVIDASALSILASNRMTGLLRSRAESGLEPAILTPHIGEFKRFGYDGSTQEFEAKAQSFAIDNKCILLLKNHKTVINTPDGECYINKGSNSGMAKGGSGDVLAGLIGGFLASGFELEAAAQAGVFIHSLAGQLAAKDLTEMAMLPTDVVDYLPEAYKELGW